MIKPKSSLITVLENKLKQCTEKSLQEYAITLKKEYNFKIGYASKLLNFQMLLIDESDFIIFCIADVIGIDTKEYFSSFEIKQFQKAGYNKNKLPDILKLPVAKIGNNQYLYPATAKWFMQLNHDQLIRYNANTQRALTVQVHGDVTYLIPTVNMNRVNDISELMREQKFFPTPIVLNIPYDDETVDYDYLDSTGELVISHPSFFDIIDGQHRNLAVSQCCNMDSNFDCDFPIIFTRFSEAEARNYMCQMDKKEHFKQGEIKVLNQDNSVNKIIGQIKSNPTYGSMIGLTSNIQETSLHVFIEHTYDCSKVQRSRQIVIANDIINIFRKIEQYDIQWFDSLHNDKETMSILLAAYYDKFDKYTTILQYISDSKNKCNISRLSSNSWNKLNQYVKEV